MPPDSSRRRLCTSNDREALAEELAQRMWESRRDAQFDGDWSKAGPYWQRAMRDYARETLEMLEHG